VDLGGLAPRPGHLVLAAAAVLATLASACTTQPIGGAEPSDPVPGPSVSATPGTVLRLAAEPPDSLDPRQLATTDSLLLASQVFDGLVTYDPTTLEAVPAAATRWEVEDDGRRFVFHLRRGATFHDGQPVRAQDFALAWNRLADPTATAPFAFLLERVQGFTDYQEKPRISRLSGVIVRDERTLEVVLSRAWPEFVALLGHPALSPVPPSAGDEGFGSRPVGNGPYRVASTLVPGSPLLLERNDTYYGVPPLVASIEYRLFDQPAEAWPEFLAGELDVAPVPPPLLAEAEGRFGSHGIIVLGQVLYCGLNQSDPRFQDRRFREAISLALDRDVIAAEVYGDLGVPATGIVPPTIPGHRGDVCADRCEHDVDRAARLASAVPRRDRSVFLDYPAGATGDRLATLVTAQLGEVGITVTPRPRDPAGLEEVLGEGKQDLVCLLWVADYPRQQAFLEPLLSSGSPDNHILISDPGLDAVLERARIEPDPAIRLEAYVEAERLALKQMYLVPVAWLRSNLAVRPGVRGLVLDPMGRYDAATLQAAP
jgi:oligopeptide transport system substrate-binding protein